MNKLAENGLTKQWNHLAIPTICTEMGQIGHPTDG